MKLILAILLQTAGIGAAVPLQISWYWYNPGTNASAAYGRSVPERVRIDLRINGGKPLTVAYGIPSYFGQNTYIWDAPDADKAPQLLSEDVTVTVSTLQSRGSHVSGQYSASGRITLAGIHIPATSANTNVTAAVLNTTTYVAAGAGDYIKLGISADGGETFRPCIIAASHPGTNTVTWTAPPLPPGPAKIVIQSVARPQCNAVIKVEVRK